MNYQNGYIPAGYAHPQPQQFIPNAAGSPQQFPPQSFQQHLPPPPPPPQQQQQQPQQRPPHQQHAFGGGQPSPAQYNPHQPQYGGNMAMGMGFDMGGPVGMTPGGTNMMPGGAHPQMGGQQSPYTSAPFAQMPSAPTSATPLPQQPQQRPQQHPLQQQPPSFHQPSASPSRQISPSNPNQPQFPQPGSNPGPQQPSPQSASINAPPNQSQQATSNSQQPPLSPVSREREKERVSLLLLINGELIKEVVKLQGEGKAGIPEQAQKDAPNGKDGTEDPQSKQKKAPPHPEFLECMRRLQANLAYLATIADRSHKPAASIPASPAILLAPEKMPNLTEPYKRLLALFPGAPQNHSKPLSSPARTNPQQSVNPAISQARSNQLPDMSGPAARQPNSSAGLGGSIGAAQNSFSADPGGATFAEQNYKRWLEEMHRSSPQKENWERARTSAKPEQQ